MWLLFMFVGGVVGLVAVWFVLVGLLWFCIRLAYILRCVYICVVN